ncbi:MAG: class I SAM-dependent methyltransferase [Solirubrobacteraceae bacterium]
MTKETLAVFHAHAPGYDDVRRRLIPPFEPLYGTAVEALGLARRPVLRVLDVGAGTGLLSGLVLAAHPGIELHLLDGAPAMLAQARITLAGRAQFHEGDFSDGLPAGPWDAIVSALAIHHLEHADKRALFVAIHAGLAPGGVFVNAEHVAGPTPWLEQRYEEWHARTQTAAAAEWAASLERRRLDRRASVETQLHWLSEAGFEHADCMFKDHCFAVLAAAKATAT